jgi:diamine N-acetyltransferase
MISAGDMTLSPPEKDDISFIVKCGNEKGIWSLRQSKKKTTMFEQQRKLAESCRKNDYFIFVAQNGQNRHGVCEIMDIDWVHKNCLINIFIEDRAEKSPIHGKKILNALVTYIFDTLGLNKISTNILLDDVVMMTLFKSFGFQQEVRKRQHMFLNGSYKTVIEMAILANDFRANK